MLTGGLTGVEPPARPNVAEGHGNRPPATIQAAETMDEEPGLVRVVWSKRERRGRPELAGNELEAVAGARPGARGVLRGTTGAMGSGVGLLGCC